ncbi:Dimethylaniline monooxygenase N-oxide-forming 5 [Hondaea fermentalgiana]|uniref:Dimethylaniline monooxygenase N-oxide-forming 5 n=1 Tax=Hondaea fermentalgiana TaxID=2315210 RepID=A0A2R5GJT9_9STRA|nr:Dimethylaniline monooxygenase N-oxide-forming 5 [Hondaea fermentalgiana]|eukprot:GBG31162.1 Dimethylaniline monooxygenase N-oxide-forming 5 [Hondaea fermentalgiana]
MSGGGKGPGKLATAAAVGAGAMLYNKYVKHSDKTTRAERCKVQGVKVAILGGGMSGMCAAIKLMEAGIPFEIFEKSNGFGGTWRHNDYPDCGCDVPSHLYSFSFEPRSNWSRKWAKREEILAYFEEVAAKYGLAKHTHFGAAIKSAHFNNDTKRWNIKVEYADGSTKESEFTFFVPATGQLGIPKLPNVPGIEDFKGVSFHTTQWDHSVDMKGKRVIGIGTGASAIQAFPVVAKEAKHMTVIQRSPIWAVAKDDFEYTDTQKAVFEYVPFAMKAYRSFFFLFNELLYNLVETRNSNSLFYTFCRDAFANGMMRDSENRYPAEKIIPEYGIGCKRVALAENWFPMLSWDNVDLITSAEKSLKRITPTGVEYSDGSTEEADVLIYATGFYSSAFMSQIDIRNGDGLALQDFWSKDNDYPRAFKSMAVPNFPNLFFCYGPGSNLAHSSIIFMVETQVNYAVRHISYMIDIGAATIEVKEEKYEEDTKRLQSELQQTTFADPNCTSWYKRPDGTIINNWAGNCIRFWHHLSSLDKGDYQLGARL